MTPPPLSKPRACRRVRQGDLDAVFAALADATRRRILTLLLEDDMAVSDVAAEFDISLAAISRHLGVLAAAGLIRQERRGRITWCQLEPESLRTAAVWMRGFGQLDPLDLDAFERFVAHELDLQADDAPPGEAPPSHKQKTTNL